jgi:putative N6-adenine-specific DNA methylase
VSRLDLIVTSAVGLEAVAARELGALGYEAKPVETGRVAWRGDELAICRSNLWLRSADRVLVRVGTFEAQDFGTLFDATYALPWHEWIPADAAFPVAGRSVKSRLESVPTCQKIVKKAIVEKLRDAHAVRELPETGPTFPVEVALLKDTATLTIDTAGTGLHKRGYRTLVGAAPLRETLAAALVMLSFWRPERALVDPFCGTGTIAIEAALIGRRLAPGRARTFAAEAWPWLPPTLWTESREEARDLALAKLPEPILATDLDPQALGLARHAAQAARVDADIRFEQRAFADLHDARTHGCVITNPPYGERLGARGEIDALYRSMRPVLDRLPTWSHYILTAYPQFETVFGCIADRRRKLYNAQIECTYYQFHGPRPERVGAGDSKDS